MGSIPCDEGGILMELNRELADMINTLPSPNNDLILWLIEEVESGKKDRDTLGKELRKKVREYVSKELENK